MSTLLVVDNEPNVRFSLEEGLRSDSLDVVAVGTAREAIEAARKPLDAVLLDVLLPDMSGLDVFEQIRRINPRLPVIFITAHATTDRAIEAMKRGAFEFLTKPLDLPTLRMTVGRALELSRPAEARAVPEIEGPASLGEVMLGQSPEIREVYKAIGRVAVRDVPVLIRGESGTGKELVARAIHRHSDRSSGPLVAINCAAIPEGLLESELFGHERGTFTGAERRRVGKFEEADGGILFLDEVGDMSSAIQSKVLRLLQGGEFERLGGGEPVQTDVRVISATNRDLEAMIDEGRFRLDLYYRLKGYEIAVPPLRERTGDLLLLVNHFIHRFNAELGRRIVGIAPECIEALQAHPWPGNVRELKAVVRSAMILAFGEVLTPDLLPEMLRAGRRDRPTPRAGPWADALAAYVRSLLDAGEGRVYPRVSGAVDRVVLEEALHYVGGNQVKASELLGIARNTLRAKMVATGLTSGTGRPSDPD